MRTIPFLIFGLFLISCHENTQKTIIDKQPDKTQGTSRSLQHICFLSISGNSRISGKIVSDSLVLQLNIDGNAVTGIYNWIPAEKDARRGKISAEKEGNLVRGFYEFSQEGMEQTQPIRIELNQHTATVATNFGKPDAMKVTIEKMECW